VADADQPSAPAARPARNWLQWGAWQPLTGGGVAAFGAATATRTLVFHLLFALLAAVVVTWSVRRAWFPPFQTALTRLPERSAEVRAGQLFWPDTNAVTLGENPQLAVAVDPAGTGELGRSADLQLELRAKAIRFSGLFGEQFLPYPPALQVSLDHTGGPAAWGAWNWVGLVLLGGSVLVSLLALWWLTGIVLAPFVWLAAFLLRRELTLGGSWRLVTAAWLPATLVLLAGILLYALSWLRLTGLALTTAAHLLVMPLWLVWAIFMLPNRTRKKMPKNPFNPESSQPSSKPSPSKKPKPRNPFGKADE
jgi:hypothetical protein